MAGAGEKSGPELVPEVGWQANYPLVRRIDALWCKGERVLCGALFLAMSLLVFAAVVSSIFAGGGSWYHSVILFGFVYLGCRTRVVKDGEQPMSQALSLGISAVMTAGLSAAVHFYTQWFPGGLPQASALALCMMLWVALLGASITTYDRSHLALEFGEKLWPERYLHLVKAAAKLLTAAICVLLFWLSYLAVKARHANWESGNYQADFVPGLDEPFSLLWLDFNGLPQWVVLVIVPYTFAAICARMLGQSYALATRTNKPEEEQLPT